MTHTRTIPRPEKLYEITLIYRDGARAPRFKWDGIPCWLRLGHKAGYIIKRSPTKEAE